MLCSLAYLLLLPQVNLVNADLLAKKRGLRIVETVVPSDGAGVLDEIEVSCTAMHGYGEALRRLRVLLRADGGALQLSANPSASAHPQVAIGSNKSKFSSAVTPAGRIAVAGTVKSGTPFLTRIGAFDVDLAVEVRCMCTRSAHNAPSSWLSAAPQDWTAQQAGDPPVLPQSVPARVPLSHCCQ